MTYGELSYRAKKLYTKGKITICEYLEMTKPLDREIEQEPKTGQWIDSSNGWMCSECNKDNTLDTNYCPNCGTKMRGKDA